MSTFFRSLTDKRSALVYIDDIYSPGKSFYMLLKVKFFGHEKGNNTIKPIPSKIEAIKRIRSPNIRKMLCSFQEA